MFRQCLLLFIISLLGINAQFERGDPCLFSETDNIIGECQIIHQCEYASKRTFEDQLRSPSCGMEGNTEIVCCPKINVVYKTGVYKDFFIGTNDGILKNDRVTCRYDGYLPISCCPIFPDLSPEKEPLNCPRLKIIKTPISNKFERIAWKKCMETRRFVDICIEPKPGTFERTRACNIQKNTQRISSGRDAKEYEFPHMAVLGVHNSGNDNKNKNLDILWVGGGSLISDKFILTAAHVLREPTHGNLRYAMLGSINRTDLLKGYLYTVLKLYPHKLYQTGFKHDDIALVELDRQVQFSEFIRPICLPVPEFMTDDKQRIIAGWGDIGDKMGTSKILQTAVISESSADICKNILSGKNFTWDSETMICCLGDKLNTNKRYFDSCEGDSGGPLMSIINHDGFYCHYVVHGLVSWGPACGHGSPSSYTRVSAYLEWIVKIVWPMDVKKYN